MREEEAHLFFGRKQEISDLAEKFRKHRIVAIVADSGTGKSSLAEAGFVPAFRGGALADLLRSEPDDRVWHVVSMRPRANPEEGLRLGISEAAEKLGRSADERAGLRGRVDLANPSETAYALQCDLPARKTSTLLIVDQFEELFTETPDALSGPFVKLLLGLADSDKDARVLLTVRADYFNLTSGVTDQQRQPVKGADGRTLFERLNANGGDAMLRLKRISDEGLTAAVCEPLRLAGEGGEPALEALLKMVKRDISDQPSDLPLLQVALRAAWQEHKARGRPMVEAYQFVGGVRSALANEAENVRNKLSPDDKARLESIFVRLVRPGETGGATRRTASLDEFDKTRRDLLQRLGSDENGRLVAVGATSAEIAHEALITQWPWLQRTLRADARDVRRLDRLMTRTGEWSEAVEEEKRSYLAFGAERDLFGELAAQRTDWLSPDDQAFIAKSMEWKAREQRRELWMTWSLRAVAVALAFALVAVGWFYLRQRQAATEIQRQLDRANRALAESINNDLDLKRDQDMTPRQRQALWKLAVADEPTKSDYLSILTDPEEMDRASRGLAHISRALGLLGPSAAEVESLLGPVFKQISQATDPGALEAPAQARQALAAKLTDAQTSQAFDLVLTQIGQPPDFFSFQALAHALSALAGKLTGAQASQALDPALKQIGQTTNPDTLQALARALRSLAPKLGEAQASRALDPVVDKIRRMDDSSTLRALAQVLQALPVKLTEAQASQALDPVLKQIGQTTDPTELQALAQALQALAAKLTEAQANQALDPVLDKISWTDDSSTLQALANSIQALPAKLTDARASQALNDAGLKHMGQTTDPGEIYGLAQALSALAAKLTEAQASQALDPVLKQIGQTTNPDALQALARALGTLAPKLGEAQARQALELGATHRPDDRSPCAPGAGVQALQALPAN